MLFGSVVSGSRMGCSSKNMPEHGRSIVINNISRRTQVIFNMKNAGYFLRIFYPSDLL
jgi:hypothetical protein